MVERAGPADGDKAPAFTLETDGGGKVSLSGQKGKKVVVYFYPKDDTPGCTKESIAFTGALAKFEKANTTVIGVSRDSCASHAKFREKYNLEHSLGADEDGKVSEAYGVWVEKSMYGKKSMGIERSTFLIDGKGVVCKAWRRVSVDGHVDEVLEAAKGLDA
ncbi:MAG: peroxiredoxin [Alphaproteobacteria bacterium]|nr:peroxiredoxin [Alphaproteobacteria bacterium]